MFSLFLYWFFKGKESKCIKKWRIFKRFLFWFWYWFFYILFFPIFSYFFFSFFFFFSFSYFFFFFFVSNYCLEVFFREKEAQKINKAFENFLLFFLLFFGKQHSFPLRKKNKKNCSCFLMSIKLVYYIKLFSYLEKDNRWMASGASWWSWQW